MFILYLPTRFIFLFRNIFHDRLEGRKGLKVLSIIYDVLYTAMFYGIIEEHREKFRIGGLSPNRIERGGRVSVPFMLSLSRQRCLSYLNELPMRAGIGRYVLRGLWLCHVDSLG